MIIKIKPKTVSLVAFVLAVIVVVAFFIFYSGPSTSIPQLPVNVVQALEYFNAANSNATILVPSIYYTQAATYSINNNKVVANDSEYAGILLGNKTYPGIEFVLLDMGQLNYLNTLYSHLGITPDYNISVLPSTYTITNLSESARNCLYYYGSASNWFAECANYAAVPNPVNTSQILGYVRNGDITLAEIPGYSGILAINASVFYNGTGMTYLPSSINSSSQNFENGVIFVYENLTALYLPQQLMSTFYGKNMFLPRSMVDGVLDGYGEARVVSV